MRSAAALLMAAGLGLGGCMAAGLEVAGAGAGGVVDAGLGEVRSGAVLRTFTLPLDDVHAATVQALDQMGFAISEDTEVPEGRKLVARTERHDIDIDIVRLSPKATRLRVLADDAGVFKKDPATGHEIVHQAVEALARGAQSARAEAPPLP